VKTVVLTTALVFVLDYALAQERSIPSARPSPSPVALVLMAGARYA